MALISVRDLELRYRVYHQRRPLKDLLFGRRRRTAEVRALAGVTFEVREGERLGVIGHNGAGKSTLLRVLAGIYPPTAGECRVDGRVCSLFDIALGFELDASGWDNIRYRGYLLRQSPRAIRARTREIAEFSELGDALDLPLRCLSTGMLVRLAFAISTAVDPEVLLVDEVLAAGDKRFQAKARQRVHDLIGKARLIVLVSHDLLALAPLCDRVLWLEGGRVRMLGPAQATIDAYLQAVKSDAPRAA